MDELVTLTTRTMDAVDEVDGATDSLVIRITAWRDGGAIRARLWNDATGDSEVIVVGSEDELLTQVGRTIRTWVNRHDA